MTAPDAPRSSAHDETGAVMDERIARVQEHLDAVAAKPTGRRERHQVGGGEDWARLQQRLEADTRRHHRVRVGLLSAVAACAVVAAGVGLSQMGGGGSSVRVVPAASAPADPAGAAAIASAQAEVAGQCPAATDVPTLGPDAVDEGQRLSEGLTVEQAIQQAHDGQQASVLDAWLRCTYPDAYGQLRVEYEPQFHVVVALTDAAGSDPLAGAPVGVLAGRVQLETIAFSQAQMQVLWTRVDTALDDCGLLTSSSIELGVIRIGAGTAGVDTGPVTTGQGAPGVEAVERCLDAADLGEEPGRAQVEVTHEGTSATSDQDGGGVSGPVVAITGYPEGTQNASGMYGTVSLDNGCLRMGDALVVWPQGATWDEAATAVVLKNGTRIGMGDAIVTWGTPLQDLTASLGEEGASMITACGGVGVALGQLPVGGRPVLEFTALG